jgi:glucose dehydrogenase
MRLADERRVRRGGIQVAEQGVRGDDLLCTGDLSRPCSRVRMPTQPQEGSMSDQTQDELTANDQHVGVAKTPSIDRRKLIGAGAGVAGAMIAGSALASSSRSGGGVVYLAQEEASPPAEPQEPDTEVAATPETQGPARPPEYDDPTNWPSENGDLQSTRLMRESSISTGTIDQFGLAWTTPITTSGPFGALVATAMVAGDTVYQQDGMSNVHAINKETGEVRWTKTYDADVPSGGPNGVAVAYGRVFYSVGGGIVHCIDAETGDDIWETDLIGPLDEGIDMAPLVYDNVVYISTIPGSPEGFYQPGQRGVFYGLDVQDGSVLWYWETVNDNLWGNPRVNSGGGLWHPPTVDEQGNIYLAVANRRRSPELKNGRTRRAARETTRTPTTWCRSTSKRAG